MISKFEGLVMHKIITYMNIYSNFQETQGHSTVSLF